MQLRLTVEYEGTAYRGWQLQPDGPTVQAGLGGALATARRGRVGVGGAGGRGGGVHAWGRGGGGRGGEVPADLGRLLKSLNALTPDDVAVRDITVVDDGFDPRRHARSRTYEYRIWNAVAPSPFWRRHAWHLPTPVDVAAMDEAARALEGEHDFATFRAADAEPVRARVRRVIESRLRVDGRLLVYRVEATAFLKHMVRNVVGTLVEVGRGERSPASFPELLAARDRTRAGATAPAHGLILVGVRF